MKKIVLVLSIITLFTISIFGQNDKIPLIGSVAPSFKANSTKGKITFPDDFGKSWKILFSHPADFTPVCSSELLEMAYMQPEFDKLNVKVAVISTDDVDMHGLWVEYLEGLDYKNRGNVSINFPLIEDTEASISKKYGMLHLPTSTTRDIRGVFIIDDKNIVRSINFYPLQVGRNMKEIARVIEALQTTEEASVYTPANWEKGDDVIIPYYPFKNEEEKNDPEALQDYYRLGNRIWFKKEDGSK